MGQTPILDVAMRWFSSYMMVDWFREQQVAVQMYDVQHGAEASKNDAYKANRLLLRDRAIMEQSVVVLAESAAVTKTLEATKHITIFLVLPYIYKLIKGSGDGMLHLPWRPAREQWLRSNQLNPAVRVRASCCASCL